LKNKLFSIEKFAEYCTTVDLNPPKNLFHGFPKGGPMDVNSATQVLEILDDDTTIIETALRAATIKFKEDCWLVITGADMGWCIDLKRLTLGKATKVKSDQVLTGTFAKYGFRSYLGITDRRPKSKKKIKHQLLVNDSIEIQRGPDWNCLSQDSKMKLMMYEAHLTPDADRTGAYLIGDDLILKTNFPKASVCTFPGVIQLLPNGQLVILLNDGQNTGGYPRVAYLKGKELTKLSQLRPGSQLTLNLSIKSL